MTVYAVFRTAVYRHECGGVFSTLELATAAADKLALSEPDDHHSYEVIPFALDVMGESKDHEHGWKHGGVSEPEIVYNVARSARPKCVTCKHTDFCHDKGPCCAYGCGCTVLVPDGPLQPEVRRVTP